MTKDERKAAGEKAARDERRKQVLEVAVTGLPLVVVGVGFGMVYPPLGLIVPGLLWWWDVRPAPPPPPAPIERPKRRRE